MNWHVLEGQELRRDEKISIGACKRYRVPYNQYALLDETRLWTSDSPEAPTHPDPEKTKAHCLLVADLRQVPKMHFKKRRGVDGHMWDELTFDLTLTAVSAGFKFALEVDGQEMGSVEAKWED